MHYILTVPMLGVTLFLASFLNPLILPLKFLWFLPLLLIKYLERKLLIWITLFGFVVTTSIFINIENYTSESPFQGLFSSLSSAIGLTLIVSFNARFKNFSKSFLFDNQNIFIFFISQVFAFLTSQLPQYFPNQNVTAFAYVSLGFFSLFNLLRSFQPARRYCKVKAFIITFTYFITSFLYFQSRLSFLFVTFSLFLIFIKFRQSNSLSLESSKKHVLRFVAFMFLSYYIALPLVIPAASYLRLLKGDVSYTYTDKYRLIAAPAYVLNELTVKNKLLFGFGYSNTPQFQEDLVTFNDDIPSFGDSRSAYTVGADRLHNAYLTILYQYGFLGLSSFLMIIYKVIVRLLHDLRYDASIYFSFIALSASFLPSVFMGMQHSSFIAMIILVSNFTISKTNAI